MVYRVAIRAGGGAAARRRRRASGGRLPKWASPRPRRRRWVPLFLQLAVDRCDVLLQARIGDVVALVLVRDLPSRGRIVSRLAALHRRLDAGEEVLVELRVLGEIGPRHHRAVAGDDRVDVLDPGVRLGQRVADLGAAAAVVVIEERQVLAGEDVAGVDETQLGEDDESVAVGVAAAEVVEIDAVLAAA